MYTVADDTPPNKTKRRKSMELKRRVAQPRPRVPFELSDWFATFTVEVGGSLFLTLCTLWATSSAFVLQQTSGCKPGASKSHAVLFVGSKHRQFCLPVQKIPSLVFQIKKCRNLFVSSVQKLPSFLGARKCDM